MMDRQPVQDNLFKLSNLNNIFSTVTQLQTNMIAHVTDVKTQGTELSVQAEDVSISRL